MRIVGARICCFGKNVVANYLRGKNIVRLFTEGQKPERQHDFIADVQTYVQSNSRISSGLGNDGIRKQTHSICLGVLGSEIISLSIRGP